MKQSKHNTYLRLNNMRNHNIPRYVLNFMAKMYDNLI